MGLFYARFGEDGREERKEKARRRCGGAPWLLLRCLCLGTDINNKGVALYGLRLAGLWLPRLVLFIGLLRKCR